MYWYNANIETFRHSCKTYRVYPLATESSILGLAEYICRDIVVCQHTIAAAPPLRHAIALHLRYAKSRGKWQR